MALVQGMLMASMALSHLAVWTQQPAPDSGSLTSPPAFVVATGSAMQPATGPAAGPATGPPASRSGAENNALQNEITPELTAAIDKGLAALVELQNEDGSFGAGRFSKNVAVTSLACLAIMADGHIPGRGRYGEAVRKGLEFVLKSSTETGLLAADSTTGPMYGHGFAALFLGEVYGMTQGGGNTALSERTHDALLRACRLIERTQNEEGGWRYNPVPYDADVSVTITQIMALRSARNAGIEVSKQTIDRAVIYVRECQNQDGGFRYQRDPGASAWPRSAAGVASLYYAGIYDDPSVTRGMNYLMRAAMPGSPSRTESHYFYGMYYTAQTMYLAGGDAWARWWPAARTELLERQQENGSWNDPSVGPAYGTAMALIVLQMPKRYLPIFQK